MNAAIDSEPIAPRAAPPPLIIVVDGAEPWALQ